MKKVFIDGSVGTTGLRIYERLQSREDIQLLTLPEELRKDVVARKEMLNSVDVAFLCLPDEAAREAVTLIENPNVKVIDASTAHRTEKNWAYGFAELGKEFEEKIRTSTRIANPGCHASGFIALVYPLVEAGILDQESMLTCTSVTGYSGGGKKMIADYENPDKDVLLNAPRQYGLTQSHKHLKEMQGICGLNYAPAFSPIVGDFYSGMTVTVPVFAKMLKKGNADYIQKVYQEKYAEDIVKYVPQIDDNGFVSAHKLKDKDSMRISVCGNAERILLVATYDNLGKGASGSAVECMNLAIGQPKTKGLVL